VTNEHAGEGSQQPTRKTATGGASCVVLEYGWASPHLATYVGGTGGSTYLDLVDWVGTERMRVNSNQSSQETCTGLPFGDMQSCTGTDESPMHFTGQQWDSEDNLTTFWFRSDSTTQGRWSAMDPSGLAAVDPGNPQTWNRYAYVTNNPLRNIDPLGLDDQNVAYAPSDGPGVYANGGYGMAPYYGGGFGCTMDGFECGSTGIDGIGGLGSNAVAYCPQCANGNAMVDAKNGIWQWMPATEVGTLIDYGTLSDEININDITYTPNQLELIGAATSMVAQPANNGGPQYSNWGTITKMVTVFSRITHPFDVAAVNASMFIAAGGQIAAGGAAVVGGCLDPTPFEPATCAAGATAGGVLIPGGVATGAYGVYFFKNYTLPAFAEWGQP
jgi:RHS repeat-associated protein